MRSLIPEVVPILMLMGTSVALFSWNAGFPLGYHIDEVKKVDFVLTGNQDFRQPILMLELARAVNGAVGTDDPQRLIEICRAIVAVCGMLLVGATYLLGRLFLSAPAAGFAAAITAVTPLIAVHAHYFKEDILLTLCLLLALVCMVDQARHPGWLGATVTGCAMGLAASAHYKGWLLAPLLVVSPWLLRSQVRPRLPGKTLDWRLRRYASV